MRFRPCIDIHDGQVKQIVGSSLNDSGARENYVASNGADYYARLYRENNLQGGHIILLNKKGTPEYESSRNQGLTALEAYPDGMQIGGGIDSECAREFIEAGASHVIVTSYVFRDGMIDEDNLHKLKEAVGRERIVLDLSCRKTEGGYYIATDRWQKLTKVVVTPESMDYFADYASEFLIHAVDVEGKQNGIETELVERLADWRGIPITYAGGVKGLDDLETLNRIGEGRIDVTIGSALDIFGGHIPFKSVVDYCR